MKTTKNIYRTAPALPVTIALACGLAATATLKAQDIYVANSTYGNTIGEYGLDGSTINAALINQLAHPYGIAISGNDLFVGNTYASGSIGEYGLNGSTVNASLIGA